MDLLIFYGISFVGWQVLARLKMPGASIIGPILAIGMANCLGISLHIHPLLRPILSIMIGFFIGLGFKVEMKGMLKEIILVSSWMIATGILTGYILYYTGIEKATAMFAALPGGLAELSLMAMSFGAEPFQVALLQSTRLICLVIIITFMAKKISSGGYENKCLKEKADNSPEKKDWIIVILLALCAGMGMEYGKIAAGGLLGAIMTTAIYTKYYNLDMKINSNIQTFAQMGVGGLIGMNVTKASIYALPSILSAIIVLNVLVIGSSLILSIILHKITKWDYLTCLLSTAPGGLTVIVLLALELKADTSRVTVLHLARLMAVIIIAPLQGYLFL